METKLIYWPHIRGTITKEEILAISQVRYPWPKDLPLPISEEEAERRSREINELARKPFFYTETQFERLEQKPDREECYEFHLGKHSASEPIPVFQGFTPRFCLGDSGFKNEGEVDLLEELWETGVERGRSIKFIHSESVRIARELAGTSKAYESKRNKIEETFRKLNENGIDFLVFRTYRNFPAAWDNINFYSQGNFDTR